MDVRSLLRAMLHYKWIVLSCVLVVGGGVALWTLRLPKVYEATCVVEYDPDPVQPLGDDVQDVADPLGGFWSMKEFFETQNRVIASRNVAERVVEDMGLHHDAEFWDEPPQTFEPKTVAAAARRLMGMLHVEPVKDTRLVEIRLRNKSAERAQVLANGVAQAYRTKTIEDRLGATVEALDWLSEQLESLRHELDDAEIALHSFKVEHNVLSTSMEDKQNLVAGEIHAFSEALTEARATRIALAARAQRLREANVEDPLTVEAPLIAENSAISTLRGQLREKQAELAHLVGRYGASHPEMVALNNDVEELTRQLRQEIETVIAAAEADLQEGQRVEDGLRQALETAHEAGIALNLREIEYQRLNRERENRQKIYQVVLSRTTETNMTRMMQHTHVRILDEALTPSSPVSPNVPANIAAGLIAGLLLGVGIALGLRFLDRRLKTPAQVEDLGVRVIGILPALAEEERGKGTRDRAPPENAGGKERDLFTHLRPMSPAAECMRAVRTNLTFMSADDPIHSLVVTSPTPRDGKTTVACNLAVALANSGKRVLLVDTDLRRPRIHRTFGMSSAVGITSLIVGEATLDDAVQTTGIEGLDVLACGPIPPNPSELLHGAGFEELIRQAGERYDRIIFDSPPLGAVTDAAVIAPRVDGVLVVVKANNTTRDGLRGAVRQLSSVGAHIVGCVMNGVLETDSGYYQYYRYHYYGTDSTDPESESGRAHDEAAE